MAVDQLRIIAALSRHIPDLLTRDANMTSIAIVRSGGVGAAGKGKSKAGAPIHWGAARPGQSALIFELILRVLHLTQNRDQEKGKEKESAKGRKSATPGLQSSLSSEHAQYHQFFHDLENKLAVLLVAKESEHGLIPFSQRMLLCELLYRIRLYTESWHT